MHTPVRILLADDDRDDRFFFQRALKNVAHPTHLDEVEDGEELMKYLDVNQKNLPDVIFLDLNMPRKTGNECIKEIKQDTRFRNIPVVIYSTSLHEEIADTLFNDGAHYYLKKCELDELPDAINKVLQMLQENKAQPARESFIINNLIADR